MDTTNVLKRLRSYRENYYLQSLHEQPDEGGEAPPAAVQPDQIPQDGMDPAMAQQGAMDPAMAQQGAMDPAMGGMDPMMGGYGGMEEEVKTATELGRIYELKKIYNRLYILNKFLNRSSDPELNDMRRMTGDAFEIYKMISGNLKSYTNSMDDIIKHYYSFISSLVLDLEEFYKKKTLNSGESI